MSVRDIFSMPLWMVTKHLTLLSYSDRTSWEQTRLLLWATMQVNSAKKIDIKKVLKFGWDETEVIDTASIDNLRAKVKLEEKRRNG